MPVKSRNTAKVQAGPVSCDMALSGPGLVLDADAFTVPTVLGTAGPGLSLTGGYRAGHTALLSPDQDVLLVVGGQILQAEDTAAAAEVDAWRTCWPFLEGFHFRRGLWFLPSGQLLPSTAMQGGSVWWPGQSATAVLWDVPPPPPASEETSMLNNNVSSVPELPSPCGEKAAVITASTSEKPVLVVTATPPATAHSKRPAARKKLGAPPLAARAIEKVGPETASAPPAPPPSPPKPDPPPAWMSVSPAEVVLIGGWDGVQRLSTVMSYSTGVPPPNAPPLDLDQFSTLPTITELPQLPALSHHTATVVRDRLYVCGGNTLQGCSDALFVVDSGHLQYAYEVLQTRLLENSRHFGNLALLRNMRLGAAPPPKELTNVVESAHEGRLTSSWSCSRVQWPPVQEEPAITSVSEGTTAVRPSTSNMGNGVNRSPPKAMIVPRPAPRSSHCACCLYNRFLIIFGGRQLVLPEAGGPAGHFNSTGNGGAAKAAPKKLPKPKRGGGRGKGYTVVDEGPRPALVLLNDVAAFDCEEQMWVQVRITGGEAPAPRYGAAVCTILPEGLPPNLTREIVLHGGIGAGEEPLQDMWVLSAVATGGVGKNGAVRTLLEEDPRSRAPTLQMRWVRVRTERHNAAPTDGPEVAHGTLPSHGVATAASSLGSAEVVKPSPILARAQHALVCTRSREVYVVGGVPGVGSDPPPLTCVKLPSLAVATEVPIPQAGKRSNSGSARRR